MSMDKLMKIFRSEINGEISVLGAKNAVLKHLAASILSDGDVFLTNYPLSMLDLQIHEQMLIKLGKKIDKEGSNILISGKVTNSELIWDKRSIRNTLLILGCLLAKTGYGKVALPGGCPLGDRKYDIHIGLMEAMGAKVWEENGYLCAKSEKRLKACEYFLPIRSTGATENGILMACLADGKTRIWNPHIRPEILDLITLLRKMGAMIEIRGQESIIIEGVKKLSKNIQHYAISDNMQALTYLIGGGIAGKEINIKNFPFKDLEVPLTFLKHSGLKYFQYEDELIIRKCGMYPIDISTGPYPGINSDMQPLFAVWAALSNGQSSITDLRFVGRYDYMKEMRKMGVRGNILDNKLLIEGGNVIHGNTVDAIDLRAGAALLLLSLVSDTPTIIDNFWMIERGYDNVLQVMKDIGVKYEYNESV